MKNTNILDIGKGLIIGLVIAMMFLWLKSCTSQTPQVAKTIQTKEVKGKFEAVKPIQNHIVDVNKKVNSKNYKESETEKIMQGQIDELVFENERLNFEFNKASDSIQKTMYDKAIELKSFNQTFEDDKLKADVFGLASGGEIQSLKLDYTIKPQTIELTKQKETFLRILGGGGFGINKELNQITYKANVGFQNKKGNIIRGSYQRIGSQEYYLAEYDFSIFNLKR